MAQDNSAHAIRLDRLEDDMADVKGDVRDLRDWSMALKAYGKLILVGVPLLTALAVAILNWALRP